MASVALTRQGIHSQPSARCQRLQISYQERDLGRTVSSLEMWSWVFHVINEYLESILPIYSSPTQSLSRVEYTVRFYSRTVNSAQSQFNSLEGLSDKTEISVPTPIVQLLWVETTYHDMLEIPCLNVQEASW